MYNTIWLEHSDYPAYKFSPEGRVLSLKNQIERKLCNHSKGYRCTSLITKEGKKKVVLIHRIIAAIFCDNKLNKSQVNHIDGNKTNNNYTNLEWVTNQENRDHAVRNNLHATGEQASSKLKEPDVISIVEMLKNKERPMHICKKFNVSRGAIQDIKSGKNWSWLTKIGDKNVV